MRLNRSNLCIKLFVKRKSLDDARRSCSQTSARLVVLDTEEKNTDVGEYIKGTKDTATYLIGLTDVKEEGRFVWENGKDVVFSNWYNSQPDDNTGKNCVVFFPTTYQWYNYPCTDQKYICEKRF
ncbi:pulmonary surfactant-associated protein D-like [Gigantopelta aegis]|uniref:pulmonary surfactant-associated protein D-like n=1 Tax=Gigantopelta aegis TaxID=1735272 RepID=UPI001B88E769|nr:pulmonary surfactant-associated protein D-like [Gigantopelta aegis]